MPGQKTGFHDHDRSNVALICAQGELDEGSLALGTRAEPVRMTPGVSRTGPGGYIHAVSHVGRRAGDLHSRLLPAADLRRASTAPMRRVASAESRSMAARSSPTRRCRSTRAGSRAQMAETELSAGTSSDVIDWRCRQLRINGFPQTLAAETAADERLRPARADRARRARAVRPRSRSGFWRRSRPVMRESMQ